MDEAEGALILHNIYTFFRIWGFRSWIGLGWSLGHEHLHLSPTLVAHYFSLLSALLYETMTIIL